LGYDPAVTTLPSRVGPYRVLSRLGAGGMAETYVAIRRGPGDFEQRVCLKRIRRELDQDPEFVRQFLSEARLAATLRHANVAQVLDFGQDGDDYYLALELVDGLDLRELIEGVGAGLEPRLALYVATEIATALDFAHRGAVPGGAHGVVHRDISPSNVLVSTEGEVKLADFGIARPLQGPKHTRTGIVKGKTPYMAPEYARTAEFDVRCDLYALGVTLYECLAGERPYDGATDLEVFERAARGEHASLARLAPTATGDFVAAIERLIASDPGARFPSAAAFLDVLVGLAADGSARRDLGALVRQLKARRVSVAPAAKVSGNAAYAVTEHSDLGDAVPPTRTLASSRDAARGTPDPDATVRTDAVIEDDPPRRVGPWIAFAAASLVAIGVLSVALDRVARDAPPDAASAPLDAPPQLAPGAQRAPLAPRTPATEPATAAPSAPPAPAVALGAPDRPPASGSDPAPPTASRATVRIVVVPYGRVSVDGRDLGTAPVEVKLAPGQHTAVSRDHDPPLRRTFTVRAGERTEVTLQ
jgi:serine/threonine protein kinase